MEEIELSLTQAVQRRDRGAVSRLLDQGTPPDSRTRLGEPILSLAVASGDCDLITLLLDYGACVNKSSDQANTALMEACARGHYEAARVLLERGADPAAANKWGQTVRDWARWAPDPVALIGLVDSYLVQKELSGLVQKEPSG